MHTFALVAKLGSFTRAAHALQLPNASVSMLVARKLGTFEVITVAAPSYLKARGTPNSPEDLAGHIAMNFFSTKIGRVFHF